MRNAVEVAAGGRRTEEEIADFLNLDVKTLRKYFATELAAGANRRRVAIVLAIYQSAMKGSVPAQRAYLGMGEENKEPPKRGRPKEIRLGKKEEQRRVAESAGENSEWGHDLLPDTVQ